MESWRMVWRKGLAPQFSDAGLAALKQALLADAPELIQGATCSPPPLQCVQEWDVEACCAISYCGWKGEGLRTVQEVESAFARACFEADQRMGDYAMVRWFLNWFDDTPRPEMRRLLLVEVSSEIDRRAGVNQPATVPA